MLTVDYKKQMGEIKLTQRQGEKDVDFTIGIYKCNALAAFVHRKKLEDGSWCDTLYSFLADKVHADNIAQSKNDFFGKDKIRSIRLNVAYKESSKLLELFTLQGHECSCYFSK